ncbi:GntR family transcriptional regulator [Prauserella cavernicola]|uniref:GntR family transcriptional regulator n=1 Tax=Prauserella cavernicola TaxID=2800127 RepID=A0A934QPR8_9PSEU|nr:GntR family transcriptional regulator [Prauserella cavernicola]MBK1783871.1 GntR family transcriptional regulator [Prauserella cavernicola]
MEPIPERPQRLTETVYARIREAIVTSEIPPGAPATEAGLAERLAVSKTPVREALVRLAYVGFVVPEGRRGLYVVSPSLESIRSAYEVRIALEAQAVRLAAVRRTDQQATDIARIARESLDAVEAGDRPAFRARDREFHLAVADAAQNQRLANVVTDYVDLANTLRRRDVPQVDNSRECAGHHVRIADAIAVHDPDVAERTLKVHLSKVQQLVEDGFRQTGQRAAVSYA